jgi:hypothetical protein
MGMNQNDKKGPPKARKLVELDLEALLQVIGSGDTVSDPHERLADRTSVWRHIAEDEYERN